MNQRVTLFGVQIDPVTMGEAVDRLWSWIHSRADGCRFVVTPNADHVVMLSHDSRLKAAYGDAGLVLVDGIPVLAAAKLLRRGVPGRVPGSDLVPALFESTRERGTLRAFLLGAAPGVAERAAKQITTAWPQVEIAGVYSPPLGFERSDDENAAILERIRAAHVDVVIVGLGAPKQELWVHAHRSKIAAPVALCVGATIDFLAGEKRRAPRWMQRVGLEWLHRMASEPRRLVRRYARDAWVFPKLLWRELRA
jgi:N-acetylglucosaminyldiphosphoundecaprenol N-acetyl-beta-D-mannosaminyltransferase